jgi:hypothetical protein
MRLDQVRHRLKVWGSFWREKQQGAGFGSNSVTGRLCETLRTGIYSQGTKYQVRDSADEIYVPEHIAEVDDCLQALTASELKQLKKFYVKQKKERNLFLDRAENKLAGML